jgi:TatA/E family protein of Tat protein translocase
MNIGPLEIVVIIILALLVFGGRRIPEGARALGGGIRSLIDGVRGLHPEDEPARKPAKLEEGDTPAEKTKVP